MESLSLWAVPTNQITGQVYTASEYNKARSIPTHHELSYTPHPPKWIVFYAHRTVESGCMRLIDGRRLCTALRGSEWKDVLQQEIVYRKCMPSEKKLGFGKTWQEHFENTDPKIVSKFLQAQGIVFSMVIGWRFVDRTSNDSI